MSLYALNLSDLGDNDDTLPTPGARPGPSVATNADLHPLRENGTRRYLWWTYDRLEDLRPLLKRD